MVGIQNSYFDTYPRPCPCYVLHPEKREAGFEFCRADIGTLHFPGSEGSSLEITSELEAL